ncbi:anthranilate phosphoribosyltransferase [Candidatus Bathyarchaeota archaeon]|nr:anthranilate phosphoribosyltransferase [Candidatus Bathyarchaeota archaeon]
MIREGIDKLVRNIDLTSDESREIMKEIMSGAATDAQIGAFVTALRMKGETVQEISAFAEVMREFCLRIHPKVSGRLVDTCGTGGDKIKTFNVSTVSAFVVSGAGVTVAKHGNRSFTSKCGSADLLEKLGLNLNLEPEDTEKVIEEVGVGFMFAPKFHPAMKFAVGPRREIGIRTVFNILGPLTNPAGVNAQVLGVYSKEWVQPMAYVLKELGCNEAMVVHGLEGLDEVSPTGKTLMAWLKNGQVSVKEIEPNDFGFRPIELRGTGEASPEENAEIAFKLLNDFLDCQDSRRTMVLLNAAAGIVVGGLADNLAYGVELAAESIESGAAYEKLRMMIKASNGDLSILEEMEKRHA